MEAPTLVRVKEPSVEPMETGSPQEVAGFLKVRKDQTSPTEPEDFVMVPDNLPSDHSASTSSSSHRHTSSVDLNAIFR